MPDALLTTLLRWSRAAALREACGLLLGEWRGSPIPSQRDLDAARPALVHVIVGPLWGATPVIAAWLITGPCATRAVIRFSR